MKIEFDLFAKAYFSSKKKKKDSVHCI
jgi:hypothetical protein